MAVDPRPHLYVYLGGHGPAPSRGVASARARSFRSAGAPCAWLNPCAVYGHQGAVCSTARTAPQHLYRPRACGRDVAAVVLRVAVGPKPSPPACRRESGSSRPRGGYFVEDHAPRVRVRTVRAPEAAPRPSVSGFRVASTVFPHRAAGQRGRATSRGPRRAPRTANEVALCAWRGWAAFFVIDGAGLSFLPVPGRRAPPIGRRGSWLLRGARMWREVPSGTRSPAPSNSKSAPPIRNGSCPCFRRSGSPEVRTLQSLLCRVAPSDASSATRTGEVSKCAADGTSVVHGPVYGPRQVVHPRTGARRPERRVLRDVGDLRTVLRWPGGFRTRRGAAVRASWRPSGPGQPTSLGGLRGRRAERPRMGAK